MRFRYLFLFGCEGGIVGVVATVMEFAGIEGKKG